MVQIDKDAGYNFGAYSNVERFGSYAYQLREILSFKPESVMEVGKGDGVLGNFLKLHAGIPYTSVDFAADLKPDVVADIKKLPFKDGEFDVTCAFEVLEHLPFEDFDQAFSELARTARRGVLISVPHFGPPIKFLLKIPFLKEIRFAFKIPYHKDHVFNGQHYWEIGKKGYPAERIREKLEKHGNVTNEFVPFENQYHHFFTLTK